MLEEVALVFTAEIWFGTLRRVERVDAGTVQWVAVRVAVLIGFAAPAVNGAAVAKATLCASEATTSAATTICAWHEVIRLFGVGYTNVILVGGMIHCLLFERVRFEPR